MQHPLRVGILGATGAVGQKFIELLNGHPWFEITALVASERSAGKKYIDAANWMAETPLPAHIAEMEVQSLSPDLDVDFVFSGLDASVAGEAEEALAKNGIPVISNARNHRMRSDVPLLVPEINSSHTALIEQQATFVETGGFIVTNPNCSTVGLVCSLKPLHDRFGLKRVMVTTMQALSGAGYPGVPSLDAVGNVVPYIGGEEDKLTTEPRKIFAELVDGKLEPIEVRISAQCNRVPVVDGHLECVSVELNTPASPAEVRAAFEEYVSPIAEMDLPSAPSKLLHVFDEPNFPQPRKHARLENGQSVSIGRVRECEVFDVKYVALVHNTVRGAAGGAILNAELLVRQGYVKRKESAVHA